MQYTDAATSALSVYPRLSLAFKPHFGHNTWNQVTGDITELLEKFENIVYLHLQHTRMYGSINDRRLLLKVEVWIQTLQLFMVHPTGRTVELQPGGLKWVRSSRS